MDAGFVDRPRGQFQIMRAPDNKWRWILRADGPRGKLLAVDKRTFPSQKECWEAIWLVQDWASRADIWEHKTLTTEG